MKKTPVKYFKRNAVIKLACIGMLLCGCAKTDNSIEINNTTPVMEEWNINSATWQDENNLVLLWDSTNFETYRVYRLNDKNEYDLIGESSVGSYIDSTAEYPNEYTYKVEKLFVINEGSSMSLPIVSNTNPQKVYDIPVMMYHNFITSEDEENGIEYEEYSIRPNDLEEDLIWLENNGYTTITSRELYTYLFEHPENMPEKPIILTIDDGTLGVYTNAFEIFKKHNAKADLNIIVENIQSTQDTLESGGTREGDPAPYCSWDELKEMSESGVINICSHTYWMHRYNRDGRIGMDIMKNEPIELYAGVINSDYETVKRSFDKYIGVAPLTVAYPYSARHEICDEIIQKNTGYKFLMGGAGARGTAGNYFVAGCSSRVQIMIMGRLCRMDGESISEYLNDINEEEMALFSE